MPSSSTSASSARSFSGSEDRAGTVVDRAWMAGGIHREPATGAERASSRQHLFGLLGEVRNLAMAEPEAHGGGLFTGALFAAGGLAGDKHEHLALGVVPKA